MRSSFINRVELEDNWVHAELQVMEALHKAQVGDKIPVVWRLVKFNDAVIFDCKEGQRGVAMLDVMHKGRYWLRADKFLNEDLLDQAKEAVGKREKP